jgi:hypothetical protein
VRLFLASILVVVQHHVKDPPPTTIMYSSFGIVTMTSVGTTHLIWPETLNAWMIITLLVYSAPVNRFTASTWPSAAP